MVMKRILGSLIIGLIALTTVAAQQYPSGGGHTPAKLQEYKEEHQALLQEARTNSVTAYRVAIRYYTGKRVNPNPSNGLAYLKHAANMTNSPNTLAIHDLGVATYWGLGVKADKEEGKKLILKACTDSGITKPEEVKQVLDQATFGDKKPFDPVHSNERFIYYERQNRKSK